MQADPRHAPLIALGGCVALAAAMGIGRFVYTPILPFMIDALGLGKAQAGLIASANFLGYLVGAFAAAAPLPGGRRRWFMAALAASALSTGAMALPSSLAAFLVLRFAGGVASAFVLILASALVLDQLARLARPGLSAVHFAGVGCGIAASALIVAGLAATGGGWRAQWLASGAASLLALAVVTWAVPAEPPVAPAPPVRKAALDPRLMKLIVAYGLFGFGYVITATFISAMVREAPALRSIEASVWLAVGVAAIPSVALWGWIARHIGQERALALACVVEAVGVAASVLVTSAAAVMLAALLLGGTVMGITALGLIAARRLTAGDPRRILAFMTAAFGLGQMIGPSFAGYAYGLGDSFLIPSLAAAAALLAAAGLAASLRAG